MFLTEQDVIDARRKQNMGMFQGIMSGGAPRGINLGMAVGGALSQAMYDPEKDPKVLKARKDQEMLKRFTVANPATQKAIIDKMIQSGNIEGATKIAAIAKTFAPAVPDLDDYVSMTAYRKDEKGDYQPVQGSTSWVLKGGKHPLQDKGDVLIRKTPTGMQKPASTVVNIDRDANKAQIALATDEYAKVRKASDMAYKTLDNINYIDQMIGELDTGALTNFKVSLAQLGTSFNIPVPKEIANLEAAESAIGDLVVTTLDRFSGAISEGEREYAKKLAPSLTQTKEGRQEIMRYLRALSERALKRREILQPYISSRTPTLFPEGGKSYDDAWMEYNRANPLKMRDVRELPKYSPQLQKAFEEAMEMYDITPDSREYPEFVRQFNAAAGIK